MAINADKPHLWKSDVECSIDFYNDWFIRFAPETYRSQRGITTEAVLIAFLKTANLTRIVPEVLRETPGLLPILRMVTAPPLARDRLMGLAYVGKSLIDSMEGKDSTAPQLLALKNWLTKNGYKEISTQQAKDPYAMPSGTFTFRLSLPAGPKASSVKIPIDCVIKPLSYQTTDFPILIEAKSAGNATNTNKRRKEEAQKFRQLKDRYGDSVKFLLFLCGYFEPGYLGYEAAEGIDWVWEHRPNDFQALLVPGCKKKARPLKKRLPVM